MHDSYHMSHMYGSFCMEMLMKPLKDQRSHIFDAMAEQNYSKGDVIIKQGDPGNYFYVIGKLLFPLCSI